MSKRFGRNQRRKMREQVANLARTVEMDRGLLREQSNQLYALREEIDRAKRIVGHDSALFPPSVLQLGGAPRGQMEGYIEPPADYFARPGESMAMQTIRRIPLDVLLTRIERSRLDEMQHVRVQFANRQWGYAISREAMHRIPDRDLARMLGQELAELIVRDMKGAA